MLAARWAEVLPRLDRLRLLGPELEPGEVLVTLDDVLTRTPEKRRFWELCTTRIITAEDHRYISGRGRRSSNTFWCSSCSV